MKINSLEAAEIPNAGNVPDHYCHPVPPWINGAGLAAILIASSALMAHSAFRTFDFFDMSGFMDAGYRVYRGQEPYVDFYFIAGPIHLYMHAFFYWLFGFNKHAILAHILAVNSTMIIVTFRIAKKYLRPAHVFLVTAVAGVAFYGPIAHPWYDQNAALWFVLALLAWESQIKNQKSKIKNPAAALACGMLVSISFFTKSNVGIAGAALFFTLFLIERRRMIAWYVGGVFAGTAAVLSTIASPSRFFYQVFLGFNLASRLTRGNHLGRVLYQSGYSYMFLVLAIFVIAGGKEYFHKNRRMIVLLAGLLGCSVFTAFTGSMVPEGNLVFLALDALYLIALAHKLPNLPRGRLMPRVCRGAAVFLAVAAFFHAMRASAFPAVWYWNKSDFPDYVMTNEPLRGWNANRSIAEGLDQVLPVIKRDVPADETLLVLPDATVIYGLSGHEPWRPAPFIYHYGYLPQEAVRKEFRSHIFEHPPDWILLRDQHELSSCDIDVMLDWLGLKEFIRQNYQERWAGGSFHLLRRRM